MELQTHRLNVVLQTPGEVARMIEAMSERERGQVSGRRYRWRRLNKQLHRRFKQHRGARPLKCGVSRQGYGHC
jgi:hypothetical protein